MLSRKAGKDPSRTHLEPLVALSFLEAKAEQLHLPDGEHVPRDRSPSFAFGLYWSCPSPDCYSILYMTILGSIGSQGPCIQRLDGKVRSHFI